MSDRRPGCGLFFTGTDTGVGKTAVTAAVAALLRRQRHSVAVAKPVATGADIHDGRLVSEDTRRLAEAAGLPPEAWAEITPWTFVDPAAPPVAARRQGVTLSLEAIAGALLSRAHADSLLLVEGVGGLLCPLTERETIADLVARLAFPMIIVARGSLGTLNHTLLTVEVARNRGLSLIGVLVNETEPKVGLAAETNVEELRRRDVPILGVVTHVPGGVLSPEDVEGINWWSLGHLGENQRRPCTP